jgi:hypothetical protein
MSCYCNIVLRAFFKAVFGGDETKPKDTGDKAIDAAS